MFSGVLARQGADVYLFDVDTDGLEDLLVALRSFGTCAVAEYCDLAEPAQIGAAIRTMLERWGPVDVLVNNAGIGFYGPTETMTADQWNRLLAINLHAPIQITRELLPTLRDRPETYLLNMCSVAGLVAGPRFAAYHTSKFGLVGFTAALRAEYGRRGMNVTAVCPGAVSTNLYASSGCGREGRSAPTPPAWLCTSPERVARIALDAVRRNRARVVITPLAHLLNVVHRFLPGVLDFANQFGRWRKLRKLRAATAEAVHGNVAQEEGVAQEAA